MKVVGGFGGTSSNRRSYRRQSTSQFNDMNVVGGVGGTSSDRRYSRRRSNSQFHNVKVVSEVYCTSYSFLFKIMLSELIM